MEKDWLGIWYAPLGEEIDPAVLPTVKEYGLKPWQTLSASASVDPFETAERLLHLYREEGEGKQVHFLIPGQKFDRTGTRYGRGGGWYDRFLSKLPADWIKIGIVGPNQWSDVLLKRHSWDIGMDQLWRGDRIEIV